jgi:hypothetical protein
MSNDTLQLLIQALGAIALVANVLRSLLNALAIKRVDRKVTDIATNTNGTLQRTAEAAVAAASAAAAAATAAQRRQNRRYTDTPPPDPSNEP